MDYVREKEREREDKNHERFGPPHPCENSGSKKNEIDFATYIGSQSSSSFPMNDTFKAPRMVWWFSMMIHATSSSATTSSSGSCWHDMMMTPTPALLFGIRGEMLTRGSCLTFRRGPVQATSVLVAAFLCRSIITRINVQERRVNSRVGILKRWKFPRVWYSFVHGSSFLRCKSDKKEERTTQLAPRSPSLC